jgi:hypothetical protein
MPIVLRTIAATAAVSLVFTIWFVMAFAANGGMRPILNAGALGILTVVGWVLTLVLAPFTAVQLWRLKNSGRVAGIVLFAYGAIYYLAGLLWLRSPEASGAQIVLAAAVYALPAVILAVPAARRSCS